MDWVEARDKAREQLSRGESKDAFRSIHSHFWVGSPIPAERWREAFELLADVSDAITSPELGRRLRACAVAPDDPRTLYDAAFQLYEERLHRVAANLLERLDRLQPGQPGIVTELVANLEAVRHYPRAFEVLQCSGLVGRDPWCTYLLAYNGVMSGRVEAAGSALAQLGSVEDDQLRSAVAGVSGMLARAEAVGARIALDHRSLAGWHVVLNGTFLLHEAESGFDDGMNGRYAYLGGSYSLLATGLSRAVGLLAVAGIRPERVVAAPDRSSRVLARATAERLGVPLLPWSPTAGSGLHVAYDLDRVGDAQYLQMMNEHRPGQWLWAHASQWTDPFPYAPDLTTYLYQHATIPWEGGGMVVDAHTGQPRYAEPDPAPEEELACRILDAEPEESHNPTGSIAELVESLRGVPESQGVGLFRRSGARAKQHGGSVVTSSEFL